MRFRIPLWAEIAAAILVALAISNLATVVFFQIEGQRRWQHFGDEILADRIGESASAILASPESKRLELIKALSRERERFSIDAAPLVGDKAPRDGAAQKRVASHLSGDAASGVRVHSMPGDAVFFVTGGFGHSGIGFVRTDGSGSPPPPPPGADSGPPLQWNGDGPPPGEPALTPGAPEQGVRVQGPPGEGRGVFTRHVGPPIPYRMIVSIPIDATHWLNARVGMPPPPALPWLTLLSAGVAAATLLIAAVWTAHRVAVPLQRLSEAARAMRRGEPAPPVPETGPAAVRDATRSFNAMSQRLMSTLESQRAMMVAIAHDLRTPIASLRLRAEFVNDEEARAKLLETLAEMQAMTEAVLDAARTGHTGEPARPVDISALAESLVSDLAELGGDVTFNGGETVRCVCRTNEIKRALRNLIENAQRYGTRARVAVAKRGEFTEITVDDDGPGIPEDEIEHVFEPFARLEASRSKETGGYGLGLSIARLVARAHGGDVTLVNRNGGGLRATLSLPLT